MELDQSIITLTARQLRWMEECTEVDETIEQMIMFEKQLELRETHNLTSYHHHITLHVSNLDWSSSRNENYRFDSRRYSSSGSWSQHPS